MAEPDSSDMRATQALEPETSAVVDTPGAGAAHPVVSNTTPLITLGELGLIDALRELYVEVWIPDAVFTEYERGRSAHPQRPDLHTLPWMHTRSIMVNPLIPTSLDAGERDAISLALSVQAARILLDERAGRVSAVALGLKVTGSVGVLLAAKRHGIISLVKPYLDEIIAQGRYISSALYEQIVRQADE